MGKVPVLNEQFRLVNTSVDTVTVSVDTVTAAAGSWEAGLQCSLLGPGKVLAFMLVRCP